MLMAALATTHNHTRLREPALHLHLRSTHTHRATAATLYLLGAHAHMNDWNGCAARATHTTSAQLRTPTQWVGNCYPKRPMP